LRMIRTGTLFTTLDEVDKFVDYKEINPLFYIHDECISI